MRSISLFLPILFLMISCVKPKVNEPVILEDSDEDGIVDILDEEPDTLPTQAIEVISYYKIEMNGGKEEFVEKIVEGTSRFETSNEGLELMIVTPTGSDQEITCKKVTHPNTLEEVYLDIGGDNKIRAH